MLRDASATVEPSKRRRERNDQGRGTSPNVRYEACSHEREPEYVTRYSEVLRRGLYQGRGVWRL